MRLTGLLVIQLDLFSTESYSETWNTLWYFSLIRSYMECKRLCNKVLERIENIFFLEIVLRISFRSGSNNNYTIKKFVILEETSGDQPLLKAWSGRAGWSGPCLIMFWIWSFTVSLGQCLTVLCSSAPRSSVCMHFPFGGALGLDVPVPFPCRSLQCLNTCWWESTSRLVHSQAQIILASCALCWLPAGWRVRDGQPGQGPQCSVRPGLDCSSPRPPPLTFIFLSDFL